jgi:hypothetical protein
MVARSGQKNSRHRRRSGAAKSWGQVATENRRSLALLRSATVRVVSARASRRGREARSSRAGHIHMMKSDSKIAEAAECNGNPATTDIVMSSDCPFPLTDSNETTGLPSCSCTLRRGVPFLRARRVPSTRARLASTHRACRHLGPTEPDFLNGILNQLANPASLGQKIDELRRNFLLTIVKGIEPKDQLETMLAAQMAPVHSVDDDLCVPAC